MNEQTRATIISHLLRDPLLMAFGADGNPALPTKICSKCRGTARVTDQAALGAILRRQRERVGLSAREMARRMGVSHVSIGKWERGLEPWPAKRIAQFQQELAP